jgi:DNA-binding transcriptional ArsR family regulator
MSAAPSPDEKEQFELFKAETTWFHVFRSMIEGGDVAKMGPGAFTVYAVVKAHTNFSTGRAFPGIELIAEKSGISTRQVMRELAVLEEHGYLTKVKQGRQNIYTLREKVGIQDDHGRPVAAASWDYLPAGVANAVADLKHVMMTGDFAGAKIVNIEKLTVNINNFHDNSTQINMDKLMADMDKLDPPMRALLMANLERRQNEQK